MFNTFIFLETELSHKLKVLFLDPLYCFGKYQLRFPKEFWRDSKGIQIAKYEHSSFQSLDRFWAAEFYTFQEKSVTLSELRMAPKAWRVKKFIICRLFKRSRSNGKYLDMRNTSNSKNFANWFPSVVVSHGDGSLINIGGSKTSMIPSDSFRTGKGMMKNFESIRSTSGRLPVALSIYTQLRILHLPLYWLYHFNAPDISYNHTFVSAARFDVVILRVV